MEIHTPDTVSALIAASETDDEIGTVLRLHLRTEELLIGFLEAKRQGEVAQFVKEPRDFSMKLALSVAFGLPISIAAVAQQLNSIRNKLAHGNAIVIDKGDIGELSRRVNKLAELEPGFVQIERRYIELPLKHPGQQLAYGKHGNRVDFVLSFFAFYAVALRWLESGRSIGGAKAGPAA